MENREKDIYILVAGYLAGEELTDGEKETVLEWKKANRSEFSDLERLFNAVQVKKEIASFDAEKAWAKVNPRLRKKRRNTQTIFFISSAACLLLMFGISLFLRNTGEKFDYMAEAVSSEQTCTLPDGTEVTLHRGAKIYYSEKEMQRRTKLEGDAFFEVAKDSNRPFTIDTDKLRIRVTGTSFLVGKDDDGNPSVYVRSGSVRVSNGRDSVNLERMEKVTAVGRNLVKSAIRDSRHLFPAGEPLVFDNTPVAEAARQVGEQTGLYIELEDDVKENRITTVLDITSPENAVKELADICGCRYEQVSGNHYRLHYR